MDDKTETKMILFYSGSGGATRDGKTILEPEDVLDNANIMLSYYLILKEWQLQHQRIENLSRART